MEHHHPSSSPPPPTRLMNFVSEHQLEEAKRSRGERVEDGTAHRDRPLFEILKENKDKKDAEFNERFKHRPPKALDEDESEFLLNLETSRKQYERQLADEEAQELLRFQAAVAAQSMATQEVPETPRVLDDQENKSGGKRSLPAPPLGTIIKVKPVVKKAKTDQSPSVNNGEKTFENSPNTEENVHNDDVKTGLVSYSDDDDDD